MDSTLSTRWILACKRQWLAYQLLAKLLYAIAITLLVYTFTSFFAAPPWWTMLPICFLSFVFLVLVSGILKIGQKDMVTMLDVCYPELEYSSSLLLKPTDTLALLQQLQVNKLNKLMPQLPKDRLEHHKTLYRPFASLLMAFVLYFLATHYVVPHFGNDRASKESASGGALREEALPPAAIASTKIEIRPPAYTGLPIRQQAHFSVSAPEGSGIALHLTTNTVVEQVFLLLDGKGEMKMVRRADDSLQWSLTFKPLKSGFYQLGLNDELSAFYPLEMLPDQPVAISVDSPASHTLIDVGFPQKINLNALLRDDYAIRDAQVLATISSGKGESVSFESREIPLNKTINGQTEVALKQEINLKELGMKPGDELYFYIKANDNAGQESRSDVFVVALQDTAELMSMTGIVSGVDLVPEYFRSQRQIIIDIEKLLAEAPSLDKNEANSRSNNLGVDQKLLRLRYGQFLGEESEGDIGGGHEHHDGDGHDHGEGESEVPVSVEVLMDQLTHHHDNAEDATFFDPQQKAQLKATLSEMWNSEMRLRTYKPQEALPYAYKALRLLKELQQSSRAYVGKTPSKTTPLKAEKRLSGDLEEIAAASTQYQPFKEPTNAEAQRVLQATLSYLSSLKSNKQLDEKGSALLRQAERSIMAAASNEPAKYLGALKAIRQLEEGDGKNNLADIQVVEKAIQELLPNLRRQPSRTAGANDNLYDHYFERINRK